MRASPCHQEGLYPHECAQIDFPESEKLRWKQTLRHQKRYLHKSPCELSRGSPPWWPSLGLALRTSRVSWPLASRRKQARTGWPSWDRMDPGLAGVRVPMHALLMGVSSRWAGGVTRTPSSLAGLLLIPCSLLSLGGFCYTDCVLLSSMPHF